MVKNPLDFEIEIGNDGIILTFTFPHAIIKPIVTVFSI